MINAMREISYAGITEYRGCEGGATSPFTLVSKCLSSSWLPSTKATRMAFGTFQTAVTMDFWPADILYVHRKVGAS